MYHISVLILNVLLRVFNCVEVRGRQNIPKNGGFVLTCTHKGWLDVLWLGLVIWPKPVCYMAKEELFRNKLVAWFLKKIYAFPVKRVRPGLSSLKVPIKLLSSGKIVGIFPSGTRTQENIPLKRGAIIIAQLANVPVLPAAYVGPSSIKISNFFKRKEKVIINFGEPIIIDQKLKGKDLEEQRNKAVEHLRVAMNCLKESITSRL